MPTCPTCFTHYPADATSCTADGAALVPDETFAHVDRDVPAGTVVGEYRIESKLGEGGFGAVYRAVHPLIGKMAAIKVLGREFSSNPQMVSRFVAEARAVNQIRHRNIIDIFSFGQLADGRQYYIMELLEGESFDAYLARHGRLTLAEAMPILRGIARALDAAHGKNIIHRDLKPENVFLVSDEDGRLSPKLLDFGLVKLMADTSSHKTKTGTPMGTPYYMSPEQCRGLDADARTDVYSFGVLVYEVLTGELPFDGVSTMDILVKHMTAVPPSASSICPDVPPAVDAALARILAKEAKDRPSRVGEALDLLAAAAGLEAATSAVVTPRAPASSQADFERATARTMVADGPPPTVAEGKALVTMASGGQTFLGAETDVTPPRSRSRVVVLGTVAALALLAGAGAFAFATSTKKGAADAGAAAASTVVAVASTGAASATAPASSASTVLLPANDEVALKIDGAPDGATVSANGVELGTAPGPFKVKPGSPIKVTVTAKGYKPKELTITPTENVLLPITLEKAPAAATGGGKKPPSGKGGTISSDLEGFDQNK